MRAREFRALHVAGHPFVLYNVWDAGSGKTVADAGARAIGTSSWSVAAAQGSSDGERLPFERVLEVLRAIVGAVELPVTVDLEAGYGTTPDAVGIAVGAVIGEGAIGCNLEDQDIGRGELYGIDDQCRRLAAARRAADAHGVRAFINARTDIFLNAAPAAHDERLLDDAVRRATAYAEAGADGFFAPGLREASQIEKLCAACALPVNVMIVPGLPSHARLAQLGVARISYGPRPYVELMKHLLQAARRIYVAGQE
jgi:2-methylisocitrate lyase-like PEP mutase family enzyme